MFGKNRIFHLHSILLYVLLLPSSQSYAEYIHEDDEQFKYILSSGVFTLHKKTHSVNWLLVNNSSKPQRYRVTIYTVNSREKTVIVPGPLTGTLAPSGKAHNANGTGKDKPFVKGNKYEVVVEVDSRKVLPKVEMWSSNTDSTVIPGTVIQPRKFKKIH